MGGNPITTRLWPDEYRELTTFLYQPKRWARAFRVDYTPEVEQLRETALRWLYHRAGAPRVGLQGERNVLSAKPYLPAGPHAIARLTDISEKFETQKLKALEQQGFRIVFSPSNHISLDTVRHWDFLGDVEPQKLREALVPVRHQLELSKSTQWKICRLCGRAFPALGKAKTCPTCRGRWTRRQIEERLSRAPEDPVVFRVMPFEPELCLSIAAGVNAPPALRRLCCPPPHPQHEHLVIAARTWYPQSYPEMGYVVEERRFGFFGRNLKAPHITAVAVRDLGTDAAGEFLSEVRAYHGGARVTIAVDDQEADYRLAPALVAGGCIPAGSQLYLAHVGPLLRPRRPPNVSVEPVTAHNLHEYAVAKLKGFADNEDEPAANSVDLETTLLTAEMAGTGRFQLARASNEPVGIIGWYEGEDRFIFTLATRVPFRGQGIAKWLVCRVVAGARARRCRSVIINADPSDWPIQLYRRLGFTDAVYWRQEYRLLEQET